jgi:hypothetical protein
VMVIMVIIVISEGHGKRWLGSAAKFGRKGN